MWLAKFLARFPILTTETQADDHIADQGNADKADQHDG